MNKRISNRVYSKLKCIQCKCEFIPTDARQKFCSDQHRIDYNNDKRKIKESVLRKVTSRVLGNDAILETIYLKLNDNGHEKVFSRTLLDFLGYDYEINYERGTNPKTKRYIDWFINYGIETADIKEQTFIVHKRKI